MVTFDERSAHRQKFSLPKYVMDLIIANATASLMKNLHYCCKYFYVRARFCIVDELCCDIEDCEIGINDVAYAVDTNHLEKLGNIWITNHLYFLIVPDLKYETIPKIVRCDARTLFYHCRTLNMRHFKILAQSGTIEDLSLDTIIVDDINGNAKVAIEDVLSLVPNADLIR